MDVYIKGVGSALKRIKLSMVKIGKLESSQCWRLSEFWDIFVLTLVHSAHCISKHSYHQCWEDKLKS